MTTKIGHGVWNPSRSTLGDQESVSVYDYNAKNLDAKELSTRKIAKIMARICTHDIADLSAAGNAPAALLQTIPYEDPSGVLMGRLRPPHSLLETPTDVPPSEALTSLSRSFRGAPIKADGQDLLRSLVAGVLWGNGYTHLRPLFLNHARSIPTSRFDLVFESLNRLQHKQATVMEVMNTSKECDEWVEFFKEISAHYLMTNRSKSAAMQSDTAEFHALSAVLQRPIVILDAMKTELTGKVSGVCFSGNEQYDFAIDTQEDVRSHFHPRTLFALFDGNRFNVLLSGNGPHTGEATTSRAAARALTINPHTVTEE
jgi:hypothetical protein